MQQLKEKRKNDSLIFEFRQGNEVAFNTLYLRYQPYIKSIIHRFISDVQLCDDYCQDIWYLVIKKADKFVGGNFNKWLSTISINYCIDKVRIKKRQPISYDSSILDRLPAKEEYSSYYEDRFIAAFKHFDTLTDLQKKVVYHRIKGLKYRQISNIIKRPYGTCLPAFASGIVKLRKALIKEGKITNKNISLNLRKYR